MNQFCECSEDGFCNRYNREMGGRMREICAGVNVDLGTAAVFREQWKKESSEYLNKDSYKQFILKTNQAPGDAVAMTAAIYSLHKAHPGKYITAVESYWPDVFQFNPDVASHLIPDPNRVYPSDISEIEMHYPAIHQSNERGIHFMQGWCEFLSDAIGVPVPLLTNKPKLYFNSPTPSTSNFWIICSGGKKDFTTKLWGHKNYQEVVQRLHKKVNFVQVGGSRPIVPWDKKNTGSQEDYHIPLDGVTNLINKTSLRDLFDLVRCSKGVLCGVSLLMHVAAALDKPCIVVAGGREPVAWNAYPKQQYIHTVGALPCKDIKGRQEACWRYRTVPLGDGTILDKNTCEKPINGKTLIESIPTCMSMITPLEVANLVERYNSY